jgi:hypothetical protein
VNYFNKKIDFGYIAPFEYLDCIPKTSKFHLILAHLLKEKKYVDFYNKKYEQGHYILLDNSCFEFKRPIEAEEILQMIEISEIKVDCVVAPDYLFQKGNKTVNSTLNFIDKLRKYNKNYDVMAVPQSEEGDVDDWLQTYQTLQHIDGVTHIGMSILGIANAFSSLTGTKDIMINRVFAAQFIMQNKLNLPSVNHHFLGLGQPREILLQRQIGLIDSNDSSSPIWHGINGIGYDVSFGGLINGKIEAPVEFDMISSTEEKRRQFPTIMNNITFIQKLCGV